MITRKILNSLNNLFFTTYLTTYWFLFLIRKTLRTITAALVSHRQGAFIMGRIKKMYIPFTSCGDQLRPVVTFQRKECCKNVEKEV